MARVGAGRLRVIGTALVLAGAVIGAGTPSGSGDTLRYGVSKTASGAGLAIHWVLCPGDAPRTVDVGENVGGSRTPPGVPFYWQIRSDRPVNEVTTIETYVVGATPADFYETVPVLAPLPGDPGAPLSISSPPGGAASTNGMGFALVDLPSSGVYRGDYQAVSDEQFAEEGARSCESGVAAWPFRLLGILMFVFGVASLMATAARRTLLIGAVLMVMTTVVAFGTALTRPDPFSSPREEASAFSPGSAAAPPGRRIVADLGPTSASVHEVAEGFYVARFLAPGDYAFVVGCSGLSLQIGEASAIPNGGTGGRQLIGCSNPHPVRSGIGWRPDRARLVEVSVLTNGAPDWHLVVVEGSGTVGPFDQP
jgi:hypothetical protein